MNVDPMPQEQTPSASAEELTLAFERVDARIRALDAQVLQNAAAAAARASLEAGVAAVAEPTPENLARADAARLEEERTAMAVARGSAEVKALSARQEELRFRIGKIRAAEQAARVDAAMAELKGLLAAKHDDLVQLFSAMLTLESLSGGRPWPHEVGQAVARHGGLDLAALCNGAQGRANAARTGTES